MRILIYGAGVIGSLYAAILTQAGLKVTIYARGKRAKILQEHGLLYRKDGAVKTARIRVLTELAGDDTYANPDF